MYASKDTECSGEGLGSPARPYSLLTKCAAEFLAVGIFVFIGSMQAQAVGKFDGILHAALAHGLTIFVMASSFSGLSGAVFNPAITIGIASAGKLPVVTAICFIFSQLLGGFVGSCLVRACLTDEAFIEIQAGATLVGNDYQFYQGLLTEIITSFILMTVVLMTAVDVDDNKMAPLAIGMAHTVDILATGNISASMNPGRSFGPNLAGSVFISKYLRPHFWSYHWIYYVGPLCGCVLATIIYRIFFERCSRLIR